MKHSKATKIYRRGAIAKKYFNSILGKELSKESKKKIEAAVDKAVSEYGETLRLLGQN